MTFFNGSSSVIAIGYLWEIQGQSFMVQGISAKSIVKATQGLLRLDKRYNGAESLVHVYAPQGRLKIGSSLPRPINYTCVTVSNQRPCARVTQGGNC